MGSEEQEVYFDNYCGTCKYVNQINIDEFQVEKCEECKAATVSIYDHMPINYDRGIIR